MKHTKGEWILEITKDRIWVGNGKNNNTKIDEIVVCLDYDSTYKKDYRKKILANAKLISAAPDLLEALKEVIAISDRKHDAWDKAKAAIKKATS